MGWGPRGDSGSARDRVRATQPPLLPPSQYLPDFLNTETFGDARASIFGRPARMCKKGREFAMGEIVGSRKGRQLLVPAGRWRHLLSWFLMGLLSIGGVASEASAGVPEPREAALRGFHNYVSKVEARNQEGLSRGAYLWVDRKSV